MPETQNPQQASDLDNFKPSPPAVRIDDKAARLEEELQDLKRQLTTERFCFSIIGVGLINLFVGATNPWLLFASLPFSYLTLLALGQLLGFPHLNQELLMLLRRGNELPKPPVGKEPMQ